MKNKLDVSLKQKKEISSLFRRIASQLQTMEDAEFERLIAGEKFEIRLLGKRSRKPTVSPTRAIHDLDQLRQKLTKAESRDKAREILDNNIHDKAGLQELATLIEIPIPNSASTENIKDRIVEATVGYVIRSEAIRGTQRKGDR